jgi:FtsH-binding integral membrane protein
MSSREPNDRSADRQDIERIRTAFFRKTRPLVVVLYAIFALMAAALGAAAFSTAWTPAIVGALGGFALGLGAFTAEGRAAISARTKRLFLLPAVVGGLFVGGVLLSGLSGAWEAATLGAAAGFLAAMIVGVASIRRRLARDDDLLLRQRKLGYDPGRPGRWLRW